MSCFAEVDWMQYCDGQPTAEERRRLVAHLADCEACRAVVARLEEENDALRAVLAEAPPEPVGLQPFVGGLAVALAAALTMRWILAGFGEWSLASSVPYAVAAVISVVQRVGYPAALTGSILLILVTVSVLLRHPPAIAFVVAVLLLTGSQPAALTRRTGNHVVTVKAGEVINDDVLAGGQIVRIDGTIHGDLYAIASRVEVSGTVDGRVFALAESVFVSGETQSLSAFAQRVSIEGRVGAWRAWAEEIRMTAGASTTGDSIAMGRTIALAGRIEGRTSVYGNALTIEPAARLAGLRAHLADRRGLHVSSGAAVTGPQVLRAGSWSKLSREALLWRMALTALAYIAGTWMWRRRRRFLQLSSFRLGAWWPSLARGGLRVLAVSVMSVACAITVVGLPLTLAGVVLLAIAWVAGQVVVAAFIAEHLDWRGRQLPFEARFATALLILALLTLPGWGIGTTLSTLLALSGIGAVVNTTRWPPRLA